MTLKDVLTEILTDDDPHYECRNCGTTLEEERDTCPNCDSSEIATYEFDSDN